MVPSQTADVGDRIECAGSFGTIKYVGLIDGYSEIWYGIDWDDDERGRHDGSIGGVQYFVARCGTSGSFVRPAKVETGRSCINAITSRYGLREDEAAVKLTEQQLLRLQQSINAPFISLVGFDKVADQQSDFHSLQIVSLRLQNVSFIGNSNELHTLCPNVVEIDISKNLLSKWVDVFLICSELEHLQWLNVSENILQLPDDLDSFKFENLKTLICGNMNLDWSVVVRLSKVFRNLEELRVPFNKITNLNTAEDDFEALKLLDLEGNHIVNWEEVNKLSLINNLEHLNLENTGIKNIKFQRSNMFRRLKKLVITDNLIEEWESIGELNKIPKLEDLRFLKNPILELETYGTCLQLIIARVGTLQVFNGAAISSEERKGAEYDYIKKYGLEWLAVKDNLTKRSEFLSQHNRYNELINKYGTPDESELTTKSKLIKVSLINLKFIYTNETIFKKLPPTMVVQKLIFLAQRLFGLQSRPMLTYVSGVQSDIAIPLNDEGKELGFYSIQDGDKIVVKTCDTDTVEE